MHFGGHDCGKLEAMIVQTGRLQSSDVGDECGGHELPIFEV
jgi:hypothetical protein